MSVKCLGRWTLHLRTNTFLAQCFLRHGKWKYSGRAHSGRRAEWCRSTLTVVTSGAFSLARGWDLMFQDPVAWTKYSQTYCSTCRVASRGSLLQWVGLYTDVDIGDSRNTMCFDQRHLPRTACSFPSCFRTALCGWITGADDWMLSPKIGCWCTDSFPLSMTYTLPAQAHINREIELDEEPSMSMAPPFDCIWSDHYLDLWYQNLICSSLSPNATKL